MTGPDGIALAVGVTTLYLLTHPHTRRSTTKPLPGTEADHGHQDSQDHRQEDHPREEDGPGPEDDR